MQPATDASVAGDFNNARFSYAGVTSTFSRRDGKFVVRTDGPDGTLHDYDVKYAFGTAPLQQYLIEFPDGRLQALSIAWDTRPRAEGGQRWFHLYPGQNVSPPGRAALDAPEPELELHVRRVPLDGRPEELRPQDPPLRHHLCRGQRRLRGLSRPRLESRRVGEEGGRLAASGRRHEGARHRAGRAQGRHVDDQRRDGQRAADAAGPVRRARSRCAGDATRGAASSPTTTCTAGRSATPTGSALLDDRLYYPDGQIRDEVYEYGSFLQSKMFHRGVTCSDCHDPHTLKLRAPGHLVCLGCHAAQKYATPAHHFHPPGSRGADCIGCHMPTTTYMVVDPRHDHSFRVPRPDLSVKLGVPNPCTRCHAGRSAEWAAKQVDAWYGHTPRGYQRYAEAFAAASIGAPGSTELLQAVARDGDQPAIARASAIRRLGPPPRRASSRPRGAEGRRPARAAARR